MCALHAGFLGDFCNFLLNCLITSSKLTGCFALCFTFQAMKSILDHVGLLILKTMDLGLIFGQKKMWAFVKKRISCTCVKVCIGPFFVYVTSPSCVQCRNTQHSTSGLKAIWLKQTLIVCLVVMCEFVGLCLCWKSQMVAMENRKSSHCFGEERAVCSTVLLLSNSLLSFFKVLTLWTKYCFAFFSLFLASSSVVSAGLACFIIGLLTHPHYRSLASPLFSIMQLFVWLKVQDIT